MFGLNVIKFEFWFILDFVVIRLDNYLLYVYAHVRIKFCLVLFLSSFCALAPQVTAKIKSANKLRRAHNNSRNFVSLLRKLITGAPINPEYNSYELAIAYREIEVLIIHNIKHMVKFMNDYWNLCSKLG